MARCEDSLDASGAAWSWSACRTSSCAFPVTAHTGQTMPTASATTIHPCRGQRRPRTLTARSIRVALRVPRLAAIVRLAVEPGGHEAAAVVVAEIRPVVFQGAVPDRHVNPRGELDVVLLLGQMALQVVDDLAPLRHV